MSTRSAGLRPAGPPSSGRRAVGWLLANTPAIVLLEPAQSAKALEPSSGRRTGRLEAGAPRVRGGTP